METAAGSVVAPTPRAVLVNTVPGELEMSESSWEWGQYDWFVINGIHTAYGTIRALRPDLIVLVMTMSGQSGCHLMSALRLDDETAGIPIVIYTAVATEPDAIPPSLDERPRLHIN